MINSILRRILYFRFYRIEPRASVLILLIVLASLSLSSHSAFAQTGTGSTVCYLENDGTCVEGTDHWGNPMTNCCGGGSGGGGGGGGSCANPGAMFDHSSSGGGGTSQWMGCTDCSYIGEQRLISYYNCDIPPCGSPPPTYSRDQMINELKSTISASGGNVNAYVYDVASGYGTCPSPGCDAYFTQEFGLAYACPGASCTQGSETDTQACGGGRTGNMTRTRTTNTGGVCGSYGTWSAWNESSCATPSTPTPPCPGQWGPEEENSYFDGWVNEGPYMCNQTGRCPTTDMTQPSSNGGYTFCCSRSTSTLAFGKHWVCSGGPSCTQSTETENQTCSGGRLGNMTRTRTKDTGNVCGAYGAWSSWNESSCSCPSGTWNGSSCVADSCDEGQEWQTQACTGGRSGTMSRWRTTNVTGDCGAYGHWRAWDESSCSCPSGTAWNGSSCATVCTQSTETETAACSAGRDGTMTRTRTKDTGNVCGAYGSWSGWSESSCSCPWGSVWNGSGCAAMADGVCGSSNGGAFGTAPNSGLCNAGTASGVSGSGPWNWTCSGINGGKSASCSAERTCAEAIETGTQACGGGRNGSMTRTRTVNIGNSCGVYGEWGAWSESACSCPSGYIWKDSSCVAIVDGACGSAAGNTFFDDNAPSSGLCNKGTVANVEKSGEHNWVWTCVGENSGSTASCSANRKCTPGKDQKNQVCNYGNRGGPLEFALRDTNVGQVCGTFGPWGPWNEEACRLDGLPSAPTNARCPTSANLDAGLINSTYGNDAPIPARHPRRMQTVAELGDEQRCVLEERPITACFNRPGNITSIERSILKLQTNNTNDAQRSNLYCTEDTSCKVPVQGICGPAHGQLGTSAPSSNLCARGTPTAVTGTGPWKWTCEGQFNGASASCETAVQPPTPVPVSGMCH